jgi:hypothetical protein
MTEALIRLLKSRVKRLLFFTEKVESGLKIQWVLGAEIDLVRKALDELEAELVPNHEELRQQRREVDDEVQAQIAAAGGQEAWAEKFATENPDVAR